MKFNHKHDWHECANGKYFDCNDGTFYYSEICYCGAFRVYTREGWLIVREGKFDPDVINSSNK
jgi:hypothetical protein